MKNPFSPERHKILLSVALVLSLAVGACFVIVFALLITKGYLSRPDTPAQKEVFLESPPKGLPWLASSEPTPPPKVEVNFDLSTQTGAEIFAMACALCHGPTGNTTPNPMTRVPTLNNPDFLAIADDAYLRDVITNGRSGTAMPPWGEMLGEEGVGKVVALIRSWEAKGADPATLSAANGRGLAGREQYRNQCASCHGLNGEGGLGVALNTPAVLGQLSDHSLADTIINGRSGTAMASWKHLNPQTINDLLAYLRSWQGDIPVPETDTPNRVVDAKHTQKDAQGNTIYTEKTPRAIQAGKTQFEQYCMECHGANGKLALSDMTRFAPSLNNPEFLKAASDGFLVATIARGREHTPMRSFAKDALGSKALDAQSILDIASYIRSWQGVESTEE